jgi:hypothetical protein
MDILQRKIRLEDLAGRLRQFMNERDLTYQQVGTLIDRNYVVVWRFTHGLTIPHETTIYKIKKLLGEL